MSYDISYGPVSLNSLADRKPAQKPLQMTAGGRTSYFYPTGWTGSYVHVSPTFQGDLAARLVTGLDEAHPLWKHLTPVSLDAQTAVEHALAIAREAAALDSMVPSPPRYEEMP